MTTAEYQKLEEMDERLSGTVRQLMESQAYRELAAAQMFGHGLKFVPSIKWQKFMVWHIREEFEHYEAVAKMSREVIERIAWEVVPELAETIIREQLDRLVAERQK